MPSDSSAFPLPGNIVDVVRFLTRFDGDLTLRDRSGQEVSLPDDLVDVIVDAARVMARQRSVQVVAADIMWSPVYLDLKTLNPMIAELLISCASEGLVQYYGPKHPSLARGARVLGWQPLSEAIATPDPAVNEVLSAAIRCSAKLVISGEPTAFPSSVLARWAMKVSGPDEFLCELLATDPDAVMRSLGYQASEADQDPTSYLNGCAFVAPRFAQAAKPHLWRVPVGPRRAR